MSYIELLSVLKMDEFVSIDTEKDDREVFKEIFNSLEDGANGEENKHGKRRGQYAFTGQEEKKEAVRYALEHGLAAASRKYTKKWGRLINESTILTWKKRYMNELSFVKAHSKVQMKAEPRGRPLKLGITLDCKVQAFVKNLRKVGGAVTSTVVVAAANGIVKHNDPHLLKVNGGSVELGKKWAVSLLK